MLVQVAIVMDPLHHVGFVNVVLLTRVMEIGTATPLLVAGLMNLQFESVNPTQSDADSTVVVARVALLKTESEMVPPAKLSPIVSGVCGVVDKLPTPTWDHVIAVAFSLRTMHSAATLVSETEYACEKFSHQWAQHLSIENTPPPVVANSGRFVVVVVGATTAEAVASASKTLGIRIFLPEGGRYPAVFAAESRPKRIPLEAPKQYLPRVASVASRLAPDCVV
jgi:hypothetical protein